MFPRTVVPAPATGIGDAWDVSGSGEGSFPRRKVRVVLGFRIVAEMLISILRLRMFPSEEGLLYVSQNNPNHF